MKILVTGGHGFIGHNVVSMFEQQGHDVFILDNKTNYGFIGQQHLQTLLDQRHQHYQATSLVCDIVDRLLVEETVNNYSPDLVVHLASFPRQKIVNTDPAAASQVMITGLINLLEASVAAGVGKFVYVSSSMVYGDFENGVKETDACDPKGQYGIMKLAGEWLVRDYCRKFQMQYVILRPSAVYGERDVEDRVVSKFMVSALRNEVLTVRGANEVLDFTHVQDAAQGIVSAALSQNTTNNVYNITRSDARRHTLESAARLIVDIVGGGQIKIANRDGNYPSRGNLGIAKARRDFNYNPQIDVEEGFRRYYDWYCKNPALWHKPSVS